MKIREFERGIQDGRAVYTLFWSLNPFKEFKTEKEKTDFERCIREFVFYNSEGRNPEYLRMDLSVNMNVSYEYGEKRKTKCSLRAAFNAERVQTSMQSKVVRENKSVNGYFTYEV